MNVQTSAKALAAAIRAVPPSAFTAAAQAKLRICLLDLLACALEARSLGPASRAATLATQSRGSATLIGRRASVSPGDAAFANAVAGHALVREDMHVAAGSHLGVVIFPALLALSERMQLDGERFMAAAILGYEVGGRLGRALVSQAFTQHFRPTGFIGPIAAAVACGYALRLEPEALQSAISLAANTVCGLNEWPRDGGEEMFYHPGHAARGGLWAAELAALGAYGSAGALHGQAGLFAAFGPDAGSVLPLFANGQCEILGILNKPLPVCNFAQAPCQAALALARREHIRARDIVAVELRVSDTAAGYPGCDHPGPFERILQAKMSLQFGVAAALRYVQVDEAIYSKLDDPELLRLAAVTSVKVSPTLTAAFPHAQGAEIILSLADGRVLRQVQDDVVPADGAAVRARFLAAANAALGETRTRQLEDAVADLSATRDVGALIRLTQEH